MVESRDVYICFDRREDKVRYSFVSHLSAAFHRREITSFPGKKDGSDRKRNGFSKVKMKNSRAAVVVFSENFSSSKLFREELLMVSERRRNNGLVVVPVFYPITKSVVKKQILNLGDLRSESQKALFETLDLPGHESYDTQSESDLVEEIVADVRGKLTENIGIYSKLLKIENLLYKQPSGVRRIGLWGMSGIGKTTLAKATFEQISGDYEASCFIRDFNNEFHEKGLYSLLEEHFGTILRKDLGKKRSITRPILLKNVLRKKRVLVVLDDVRKPLDAELFLGGFDWFSPGSLIIITSRDKQVFSLCLVDQVYEVPFLNEEEALWLLSRSSAFGKEIKHESLQKVIDYADGNPLALRFFGGKEVVKKSLIFEQSPSHEIHETLKSTYDSLSSNEKNIFLDIACFFKGENVDYVLLLLEGCGFFPGVGINVLIEKCLVSISEGRFVMHNLIQCFGRREVINGRKKDSRLRKRERIKYFLKDKKASGTEDIEGIFLDSSGLSFGIDPMAFKKMFSLRYLKIFSSIPGNYYPALKLPKGFTFLPDELRLLHWECFPLSSLPQEFNTSNLVILNMCYSQLQKLWKENKELEMLKRIILCHSEQLVDIQELQNARNIEVIDLQGCIRLERFLATSNFQHLRVINLSGCKKIKAFPEVPPSIEELYLKETGIRSIPTVSLSPQDNSFIYDHTDHREDSSDSTSMSVMVYLKHLKILDMSHCLELEDIKAIPKSLRKLYLGGTSIQELSSLEHLSELVLLDLENCKRLQRLELGVDNLSSLSVLNLSRCSELEEIKGIPRNLEELYLAGTAIQEVASLIKHLSKLVTLDVQNCERLQHLPVDTTKLNSLLIPKLSDPMSTRGVSSFQSTGNAIYTSRDYLPLPRLPSSSLQSIREESSSRTENATYKSREWRPLPRLPSLSLHGLIPRFYALVNLSLYNASLIQIPEEICQLPSVTLLDLGRNGFSKIPEGIKKLSQLHSLKLRHCRNLTSLPELPQSLKILNLHGCVSLDSVSWRVKKFPSHYTFKNCFNTPPQVARKRVVKSLAKVASIGDEHQQELIKALAFSICEPAGAEQRSAFNLRKGSFAAIQLTPSLRNTLLGFAIFVVVTFSDDSRNNVDLGVKCITTWKTKKRISGREEKVFRCWAPREVPEVQRDHMFVFYEEAVMHRCGGEGNERNIMADQVKFEFEAVNVRNKGLGGYSMVTECDVCVITGASGVSSLSVISASKDMSLVKKSSPKLSSVLSKLKFGRNGRFVGCVC